MQFGDVSYLRLLMYYDSGTVIHRSRFNQPVQPAVRYFQLEGQVVLLS